MNSYLTKCAYIMIYSYVVLTRGESVGYNSSTLADRYPGYGESWMFIPDGDGKPRVALLKLPNFSASRFGRVEDMVTFNLYTRYNGNGEQISFNEAELQNSTFDSKKEIKIVTHGWMSNGNSNTCIEIKNAYLQLEDYNVFVYDWEAAANNFIYPIVASRVNTIGIELAKFVGLLISSGADRLKIHLIGHSLGAHVSGIAGSQFKEQKLGRITGLDPAGPFFSNDKTDRLSEDSATFVDVIHTSGWVIGYGDSIGTADFFPNGGIPPQPGCLGLPEIIEGCSHARSWKLFRDSIADGTKFMAKKCGNFDDFKRNKCEGGMVAMGEHSRRDVKGNFYLQTNSVD